MTKPNIYEERIKVGTLCKLGLTSACVLLAGVILLTFMIWYVKLYHIGHIFAAHLSSKPKNKLMNFAVKIGYSNRKVSSKSKSNLQVDVCLMFIGIRSGYKSLEITASESNVNLQWPEIIRGNHRML